MAGSEVNRATRDNHQPSGEVYIRRVAWAIKQAKLTFPDGKPLLVGLNGKRGNPNDLSQDVITFPNSSGAPDSNPIGANNSGGVEIRDIIGNAGTSQANLVYGDVTQATIDKGEKGCWIEPTEVSGANPNPIPQPPTGLLPYEALGGDATGQAISRAMAYDYERSTTGKLNKGCGAWMFRSCWVLMSRQEGIDTADKVIAKYRPEWCKQLGLTDMPAIPADY